jgi:hypothetical protein
VGQAWAQESANAGPEERKLTWAAIKAAKAAVAPAAVAPKGAPAKDPATAKKKAAPARNAAYRKMMSLKMKAAWEKRKKAIGRGRPTAREL